MGQIESTGLTVQTSRVGIQRSLVSESASIPYRTPDLFLELVEVRCSSPSDFLRSHYTVLLSSFLLPFSYTSGCCCSLPCISQILQIQTIFFSVPSFFRTDQEFLQWPRDFSSDDACQESHWFFQTLLSEGNIVTISCYFRWAEDIRMKVWQGRLIQSLTNCNEQRAGSHSASHCSSDRC